MSSGYVTNDPYMFTHLPMPYFKYIMRKIPYYDPYDRKRFNFPKQLIARQTTSSQEQ